MTRVLLIAALALGCGGTPTPTTCLKPVDPAACWFHNTDGQFYRFDRNKMGLIVGVACECAEESR